MLSTLKLTRSVPRRPISPAGLRALGEALQGLGISFRVDPLDRAPTSAMCRLMVPCPLIALRPNRIQSCRIMMMNMAPPKTAHQWARPTHSIGSRSLQVTNCQTIASRSNFQRENNLCIIYIRTATLCTCKYY